MGVCTSISEEIDCDVVSARRFTFLNSYKYNVDFSLSDTWKAGSVMFQMLNVSCLAK